MRSDVTSQVARVFLVATLLVPVVVLPWFFFPYVTLRGVYFRVLVELATALLLYLVVRRRVQFNLRRDFVFWALVAWVGTNAIAAVFGVAPMRSIFGDHERMGGVWFWTHLLAYYVLLRTFLRPADWTWFFLGAVAVGVLISAYGLIQYRFRPFGLGIPGADGGSTIGNGGLLGVYLLANTALCGMLAATAGRRRRVVLAGCAVILVAGVLFSGNRSATLGLFFGIAVASLAYGAWANILRGRRGVLVAVLILCIAALPFAADTALVRPLSTRVPALRRLSSGVDSTRVIQWRAATEGIRNRPLLGVGPENYQIVWSRFYHPEMYRFMGDTRWDRAHNAYLDAFATAGILGFLSLLALVAASARAAVQARSSRATVSDQSNGARSTRLIAAVAIGFFVAYAFYLAFWFFDLNSVMLWIVCAAFVAGKSDGAPLIGIGEPRQARWQSTLVLSIGGIALAAMLYVHGYATLRMAYVLNRLQDTTRPFRETLSDFEEVFASPAPVTQHAFIMYAGHLRALLPRFPEIRADAAQAATFDRAFILAIEEFERQGKQDTFNDRMLVQHARVLVLGAQYYGSAPLYESALARLNRAVAIAPRRVLTQLVLGTAYLDLGQTERALAIFRGAHAVYPPLGQTHAYIAHAHFALGNTDSAAIWLHRAMSNGHTPNRTLVRNVVERLRTEGKPAPSAALLWEFVLERIGPPFAWQYHTTPAEPGDDEEARLAAELFAAIGDFARAGSIRDALPALCPGRVPLLWLAGRPSQLTAMSDSRGCAPPWLRPALAW